MDATPQSDSPDSLKVPPSLGPNRAKWVVLGFVVGALTTSVWFLNSGQPAKAHPKRPASLIQAGSICVVDANGLPVAGVEVSVRSQGGKIRMKVIPTSESGCADCRSDERYAPYSIGLNMPDNRDDLAQYQRLTGWRNEGLLVQAAPAWNLLVQVIDADGKPAPDVSVVQHWVGDGTDMSLEPTDEHGRVTLRRLSPERLELDVVRDHNEIGESMEFRYSIAWGTEQVTLQLRP